MKTTLSRIFISLMIIVQVISCDESGIENPDATEHFLVPVQKYMSGK
jgi:hypothetical protein